MKLLVLGGTHHVGRAVVELALARGDQVTTLNRGLTGTPTSGTRCLIADRTEPAQLSSALAGQDYDAVIDTWSGAPRVVRGAAELLAQRVSHYGYVSSRSVYQWPIPSGADESAPVVQARADDDSADDYAVAKRGGELAVLEVYGPAALIARAGLILGPYEQVGRLVWWLRRIERGGRVLAPGPADRRLQYVDARDLATWMLDRAEEGAGGTYNAVSPPGHTTMGGLLAACQTVVGGDSELVWATPDLIEAAGIEAWTELPIWLPPSGELAALHDGDVTAAYAAGLRCRPTLDTVADTWSWLQREGDPPTVEGRTAPGLDAEREAELLQSL